MSRDLVIAPTPTSAKQCVPPRSAPVLSRSSTANTRARNSANDSANSFARFPERHRVSHAQVQSCGSSSAFALIANRSTSVLSRITAKTVEPEPDIRAAPTSGCLSNHIFSCAKKTNFSQTGRSRSFTKLCWVNCWAPYETSGISRESRHREYAHCVGTPNSGFSNKTDNGSHNLVRLTNLPRPLHIVADRKMRNGTYALNIS